MNPESLLVSLLQTRIHRHKGACTKLKAAFLAMLLLANTDVIAAPAPKAKTEIMQLMTALSTSGCRFQRNGSWHDATEARAHLQRKYDYLLKKDKVDSAEQFVERAASRSSMSGQAYRVQCNGMEQDAATWFNGQLQRLRNSSNPRPS